MECTSCIKESNQPWQCSVCEDVTYCRFCWDDGRGAAITGLISPDYHPNTHSPAICEACNTQFCVMTHAVDICIGVKKDVVNTYDAIIARNKGITMYGM